MFSPLNQNVLGKGLSSICTKNFVLEALEALHFMDRYNTCLNLDEFSKEPLARK